MRWLLVIAVLGLSGCVHGGSGVKWWNPSTWKSGSSVRTAERAEIRVAEKREQTLRAAQSAAHEGLLALMLAGASRATDAAKDAVETVTALLDQALGALPVDELTRLRIRVDGLLSENADIRGKAEAERAQARQNAAALAVELEDARMKLKVAQADLMAAFQRENALANELRNDRLKSLFWKLGLGAGVVLFGGLYLYVRFVAGGLPGALGKMLASTNARDPALAAVLRREMDPYLNRMEQEKIKELVVKEATKIETA